MSIYLLLEMTQCIGRISKVEGILHFKDGRHRFYLEYRCSNNAIPHTNNCARCTDRTRDKIQSSGKYDHGNVNEPIPDHSHIYGGKWYTTGFGLWGGVNLIDEEKAKEYRDVAQAEFANHNTVINVPTVATVATVATVVTVVTTSIQPRKRTIKRNDVPTVLALTTVLAPTAPTVLAPTVLAPTVLAPTAPAPLIQPRKRVKPKPLPKPPQIESIIATHIENEIEEFCIDDYEIEYVKLTPFEHNDISYFREPIKNKLFERKSKTIGAYIGRYDSYTDTIRTDIPDSDSED